MSGHAADRPGTAIRFEPGVGVGVAAAGGVCLLLDEPSSDIVEQLRSVLVEGATASSVLEAMVRTGGLDLPPFALLTREDDLVRVVVRGTAGALVRSAGGSTDLRGDRVRTWLEHAESDVTSVRLWLGPADDAGTFDAAYRLADGVVPARSIDVRLSEPGVDTPPDVAPATSGTGTRIDPEGPTPPIPGAPAPAGAAPDGAAPDGLVPPLPVPPPPSPSSPISDGVDHGATLIAPIDATEPEAEELAGDPSTDRPAGGPVHPTAGAVDEADYDHLFGATQFRTVEQAAVRPEPDADPAAHTPAAPGTTPVVDAVRCPTGHLNAPESASCRVCGAAIVDRAPISTARPALGAIRFSDGRVVAVTGPLLVGRSPAADGALSGEPPELVVVDSPMKEVSNTHLEIRPEGWRVVVLDRHSTNGTVVISPGGEPRTLPPGEAVPLVPGSRISMADEVRFTFEVTA